MDAPAFESPLKALRFNWLERERASGRFYRYAVWIIAALLVGTAVFSIWLLSRGAEPGSFVTPPLIALLMVANLLPAIALMVLLSRRVAMARAERDGLASARLHTRLVALFSVLAAVPTVIVAIFASLLFQSGLEFWFSDRARNMLENTVEIARASYDREAERVVVETATAGDDLAAYLRITTIYDPRFAEAFGRQVLIRNLSEAIIFTYGDDRQIRTLALVNPYDRPLDREISFEKIK